MAQRARRKGRKTTQNGVKRPYTVRLHPAIIRQIQDFAKATNLNQDVLISHAVLMLQDSDFIKRAKEAIEALRAVERSTSHR